MWYHDPDHNSMWNHNPESELNVESLLGVTVQLEIVTLGAMGIPVGENCKKYADRS